MNKHFADYVNEWMRKSKNDILCAQRLIELEPIILDYACFHCQQAIEKSLKAYLFFNKVDVEKTHNIILLLEQCSQFDSVFNNIEADNINKFAVDSRYPDLSDLPELDEANKYYQLALEVYNLVKERIVLQD
jgi:HEPN domain-containing protein